MTTSNEHNNAPAVPPLPHPVAHIDLGDDTEDVFTSDQLFSYIGAWRELCRRLYVELWHCDKQMTSTLNEDDEPMWTTGSTVRDVLKDTRLALDTTPAAPSQEPVTLSLAAEDVHAAFAKNFPKSRISQAWINFAADIAQAIAARAAKPAQEVGLTDEEIEAIAKKHMSTVGDHWCNEDAIRERHAEDFARAIIAALRAKGGK